MQLFIGQTGGGTDGCIDRRTDERTDSRTKGGYVGFRDRRMNKWRDGQRDRQIGIDRNGFEANIHVVTPPVHSRFEAIK